MIKRAFITLVAATGLGLLGAVPAFAASPYPLNFKTFALNATDSSSTGTTFSGGACAHTRFAARPRPPIPTRSPITPATAWTAPDPTSTERGPRPSRTSRSNSTSWSPPGTRPRRPGAGSRSRCSRKSRAGLAKWYILGRWSSSDSTFHRTSVGGQGDANGFVSIDTFFAKDHLALSYRLRARSYRRPDGASPSLTRLSAIAMNLTNQKNAFPSATTMSSPAVDLAVPQYSQEIHHGDFPQYDNGGEAWCSPTSTSMVVSYWSQKTGTNYDPTPGRLLVGDGRAAVAATPGSLGRLHRPGGLRLPLQRRRQLAVQRRLRGLTRPDRRRDRAAQLAEAEPFIKHGIPLVASVAWKSNKLDTAIKSTNGHLLVIEASRADG